MAVELEGLEFHIESVSGGAAKGIDALTASLSRLKGALKGNEFSGAAKGLASIGKAAETLRSEKLEGLSKALNGLNGIKISASVSKNLASLSKAMEGFSKFEDSNFSKLEAVPKALSAFNTVKISSTVPKRLSEIGAAVNRINLVGFAQLAQLGSALSALGAARIAPSLPQRLAEIGASIDALSLEGVARLERAAKALQAMDGLKIPKLPKVEKDLQAEGSGKKTSGRGKAGAAENDSTDGPLVRVQSVLKNLSGTIGQGLPKTGAEIEKLSGGIKDLTSKGKGLQNMGADLLALGKAHPYLAALSVAAAAAAGGIKLMTSAMKRLGSSALSALKKTLSALASAARKLTGALTSLAKKGISGLVKGLKSAGKFVVSDFVKPFTSAIKTVKTWKNALGRIAFYRAVRSAIKMVTDGFSTGIKNLYEYSKAAGTQFAPAMNSLAASAQYLKNSLGAMAAPLVQALAPAIDYLIDRFVALLNIIGKVFAALTGKSTFSQAKKQAVEFGDAASQAGKALKDFTLGIDELNIISADSGSGSGGGASFGDMFEEVEVPSEISGWAAKIRESIEAGDWRSVGTILADKLNEVVDAWDAYGWGGKLGGLINNGLNVAYGFLTEFDFTALGVKVGEAFTGILDTVDFDLLGRTFAAKWNALFDFLYGLVTTIPWGELGLHIAEIVNGFIDEIHWDMIGKTFSEGVTGFFTAAKTAIQNIHWGELGSGLAEILNNIDWYGVVNGVLTTITAALDGLRLAIDGFVGNWQWQDMARQIYTGINDAIDSISWGELGASVGDGIKTALAFVAEIIDNTDLILIGQRIGDFIVGLDWVGILCGMADVIVAGINAAIKTVTGLLSTIVPHVKEWGSELGKKFMESIGAIDWPGAGKALSDGLIAALDFMIAFMDEIDWPAVGKHITDFFTAIDWDTLLAKWGALMGRIIGAKLQMIDVSGILEVGANIVWGLLKGILAALAGIAGGILGFLKANIVDPIVNGVKNFLGIHSPSTVFAEIGGNLIAGLLEGVTRAWQGILDFFGGAVEGLKTFFSGKWEEIKTAAGTAWEGIQTTLGGWWDRITGSAEEKFGKTKERISAAWSNTQSDTSEKWKGIHTDLSTAWTQIESGAQEKFGKTKERISTAWSNTQADTESKWKGIRGNLSTAWEAIETGAEEKFGKTKERVSTAWSETQTDTDEKWTRIQQGLKDAWELLNSDAGTWFGKVTSTVSNIWSNLVQDALNWGRDLCQNIAGGIEKGISWVRSAASSVASGISSYLHFSEPDVGPLSRFHTFMPDMLKLMASGILENAGLAENAAYALADKVSAAINTASAGLEIPVTADTYIRTAGDYSAAYADRAADWSGSPENSREVVSALYDVAGQLLGAMQAIADRPLEVELDGKAVTRQVEKRQRERGAGILTGGVWD